MLRSQTVTSVPRAEQCLPCGTTASAGRPACGGGRFKRSTDAQSACAAVDALALEHAKPPDGSRLHAPVIVGRGVKEDAAVSSAARVSPWTSFLLLPYTFEIVAMSGAMYVEVACAVDTIKTGCEVSICSGFTSHATAAEMRKILCCSQQLGAIVALQRLPPHTVEIKAL